MPEEIRFLRGFLGLASADLARRLGVSAATVSRWERSDQPLGMKTAAERLLRLMVLFEEPAAPCPLASLETMAVEGPSALHLRLEAGRTGWREHRVAA